MSWLISGAPLTPGTPPLFAPSSSSSIARQVYIRTFKNVNVKPSSSSASSGHFFTAQHRSLPVSPAVKYVPPMSSDMRTRYLALRTTGKSSVGAISFKGFASHDAARILKRNRSAGTVAPAKKNNIFV